MIPDVPSVKYDHHCRCQACCDPVCKKPCTCCQRYSSTMLKLFQHTSLAHGRHVCQTTSFACNIFLVGSPFANTTQCSAGRDTCHVVTAHLHHYDSHCLAPTWGKKRKHSSSSKMGLNPGGCRDLHAITSTIDLQAIAPLEHCNAYHVWLTKLAHAGTKLTRFPPAQTVCWR